MRTIVRDFQLLDGKLRRINIVLVVRERILTLIIARLQMILIRKQRIIIIVI